MDVTHNTQNQNTTNKTPSLLKQILNFFAKILSAIKNFLKRIYYNLYVNKNGLLHFDLNNQKKSLCKIIGVFMAILFLTSIIELSFLMEKFAKTHDIVIFFEKMVPLIIFALLTIIATGVFFNAAKENKIIIISDRRNIVINGNGNNAEDRDESRSEAEQAPQGAEVILESTQPSQGASVETTTTTNEQVKVQSHSNSQVQQDRLWIIETTTSENTPDQSVELSEDGSDFERIDEEDLKQSKAA